MPAIAGKPLTGVVLKASPAPLRAGLACSASRWSSAATRPRGAAGSSPGHPRASTPPGSAVLARRRRRWPRTAGAAPRRSTPGGSPRRLASHGRRPRSGTGGARSPVAGAGSGGGAGSRLAARAGRPMFGASGGAAGRRANCFATVPSSQNGLPPAGLAAGRTPPARRGRADARRIPSPRTRPRVSTCASESPARSRRRRAFRAPVGAIIRRPQPRRRPLPRRRRRDRCVARTAMTARRGSS